MVVVDGLAQESGPKRTLYGLDLGRKLHTELKEGSFRYRCTLSNPVVVDLSVVLGVFSYLLQVVLYAIYE